MGWTFYNASGLTAITVPADADKEAFTRENLEGKVAIIGRRTGLSE
jgi:hypothetical protein